MSIGKIVGSFKSVRFISIDPASHSLAWVVCDSGPSGLSVVDYGKIDFKNEKEISNKFAIIKKNLKTICENYNPKAAVVEQSVYIQNFQSSRIISYIIGFTWGTLDDHCNSVIDVNPLVWKSGIGYKNVSKNDKALIIKQHGNKNIQKRLSKERKDRVKNIIEKSINFSTEDEDINDSVGIALWYHINHGYGAVQR
jgi:Holliday junction resolvasome RuvABC endonuclease subunit